MGDINPWPNFPPFSSSPLNTQVLLYDAHGSHFVNRSLKIIWSLHIHSFKLKVGGSVHDNPNDNGPNLKLNNFYDNSIMN